MKEEIVNEFLQEVLSEWMMCEYLTKEDAVRAATFVYSEVYTTLWGHFQKR